MKKTDWIKKNDIEREWHLIDVKGQVLGRAATQIASLLIGKGKVKQVPNLDCGDYVVVINSDDIKVTRGKEKKKIYYKHSGYVGHLKEIRFDEMMNRDSRKVVELAVRRMLPDTKLRKSMFDRLFVYKGSEHKHEAQKPKEYKLI
ncbi:50S ribosomal protein L13 [Candidatus Dojkabacteria bacterium]|nr:50S ribosomal protein L13 [Candidatus Dojkabacteria bacterium]